MKTSCNPTVALQDKWTFRFKQFSVNHAHAGMKIGTDAILLGAWTEVGQAERILDIGTGCGVIALMLASKSHAWVEAIDIEENALNEAAGNFSVSPYASRLLAEHTALQDFVKQQKKTFDLIVSNPPFFHQALKTENLHKNMAKHDDLLTLEALFFCAKKISHGQTRVNLILPYDAEQRATQAALLEGFHLIRQTNIIPVEGKAPNRVLLSYAMHAETKENTLLTIRNQNHALTEDYKRLTLDFLL